MNRDITILIAAEQLLVRQSWSFMLNSNPRFSVVGLAGDIDEVNVLASNLKPEVIIVDMGFQRISEIETTTMIKQHLPSSKILVVSTNTNPGYIRSIMQNGASGYMTKNSDSYELFQAIIDLHEGKDYICTEIKNKLAEMMIIGNKREGIDSLSPREIEIIGYIKNGRSSKEIARQLNITIKTIQVHRYNILKKLNLKNAAAMVNYINNNNHLQADERYVA